MLFPTTLVGSYPQPDWLIDREKLAGRFPPRVRALELWRLAEPWLEQAQNDATLLAIRAQEEAGIDIVTDGEIRRESYSNRFATALEGVDIDNPGTVLNRSGQLNPVPRIVGKIRRKWPVEVNDLRFLRAHTKKPVKMTVPGPFTMSQQAQNDHYPDEETVAMDYAAAVNEEIRDLFAAGADIVQIDEPYMQARPRCTSASATPPSSISGPRATRFWASLPAASASRSPSRPRNPSSTARCWPGSPASRSWSGASTSATCPWRRPKSWLPASGVRFPMSKRKTSFWRPIAA